MIELGDEIRPGTPAAYRMEVLGHTLDARNVAHVVEHIALYPEIIAAVRGVKPEPLADPDSGSVLRRCVNCRRRGPYRVYMDNDCLRAICCRCQVHIDIGHSPVGYDPEETPRTCSSCGKSFTHRNPLRSICPNCEDIP